MLLLTLEMKVTTEIQCNVKLPRCLKEIAVCLTLTEEHKLHVRIKLDKGALARDTSLAVAETI